MTADKPLPPLKAPPRPWATGWENLALRTGPGDIWVARACGTHVYRVTSISGWGLVKARNFAYLCLLLFRGEKT